MIKRIIFSMILLCLFIAIPLSLAGIHHVELGRPVMAFLQSTSRELNEYKIAIPSIPSVPTLTQSGGGWDILQVLVNFLNGFIKILNFLVTIINVIISLFQYLFLIIKNLVVLKDTLVEQSTP